MKAATDYLLIVEDDPDILKLLDAALTFRGYQVVTARNGNEALEAMEENQPAIVIADIMMPKLDGFGLVHRMRIQPETRDVPVVFITATYIGKEDRAFAFHLGATRFFQKPLDLENFLGTIKDLLEQGLPTLIQPLSDIEFYKEYRRRLETKREEKIKQIARDKHLLESHSGKADEALSTSLRRAIQERDEIAFLLEQVHEQLEKYASSV